MRGFPSWQRKQDIEELLRARRPDAPASLLEAVAQKFERPSTRRLSATAPVRVLALSAVLLLGLLAVGGVGFAASKLVTDFAFFGGADHNGFFGHAAPKTVHFNPGNDQYGTTTTVASTTTTTTTTTTAASTTTTTVGSTTTTASTTTDQSSGEVTAVTPPDQSGTVTATPPGSSSGATISWSPTTFGSTPVTVTADPTPTIATGFAIQGNPSANTVVSIVVKDDNGNVIHTLPAPLEIVIKNPHVSGYVPQVSDDNGKNWRTLSACAGTGATTLGTGQTDCYYVDASSGDFHILTLHLTLFAVISKVNATTSETGRPLAAPNSGKFGDPAFIHAGKPHAHVTTAATLTGDNNVKFGFFVDEQVAAYVQVFLHGKPLTILAGQSTWRGDPVGGKSRTQVHKPVLRIGTVNANFKVHGLVRGATVKVTMIDYDGHRITRTLVVK